MWWTLARGWGRYFRNFWVGCAAGTLELLTYTRASSAEFCYPILEYIAHIWQYPPPPPALNAIKNTNLEALWQTCVAQKRLCLSTPDQSTGSTPQTKPLFIFIVKCWSSWRHHRGAISIRNASTAGSFHGRRPKTFSPHFRLDCWESIFSFSTKINRM